MINRISWLSASERSFSVFDYAAAAAGTTTTGRFYSKSKSKFERKLKLKLGMGFNNDQQEQERMNEQVLVVLARNKGKILSATTLVRQGLS